MDHALPAADAFPLRRDAADEDATRALGARVAGLLRGGEIVLLHGPLGAGKTCFVQGVCAALGVTEEVVSPTFTLVHTYPGPPVVHHLDFYRLDAGHDLADVGVPDLLDEVADGGAVALVEWPLPLLPALGGLPYLEMLVLPGRAPDARTWHLRGVPAVPPDWAALFGGEDDAC